MVEMNSNLLRRGNLESHVELVGEVNWMQSRKKRNKDVKSRRR